MRTDLPSGTVTFLFTDIEGSTKLLRELGEAGYAGALAEHRRLVREAVAANGGVEVDTQGDAFFVAFPTARGALAAARQAQEALAGGPIRVRMGIHTGTPIVAEEGYVGADVHKAARIAAVGHGGQVLVSSATAALVGEMLQDLGSHRLKDLSAPERIFQAGDPEFPPLRTLYRTNFPVPVTPFLGRDRELAEVTALIARQEVRLVTLTGPGGTGKTRLGSQAAGELADRYPGGVWWVPLAPLRDSALVLESASQAVGASDGLADHIGDATMLILFDNFEHVVDAAPDVAAVLAACPNLDVVVTSREALHLAGEHEYHVPPMAPTDGVELFIARAHAIDPTIESSAAIDSICARLDELPLAIELAAARIKLLRPDKMLERLDRSLPMLTGGARDMPERQRTLRATIEWSHDLLTADEQRLFARLSVFRGGATLEAIESIAQADLDTLQSLVDKSLVRRRGDRFVMLETIREFADERIRESGERADLERRHADFFKVLAEEAYPNLKGGPKAWLDRLDADHDNLRAALDHLESTRDTQAVLQLAGAVYRFWYMRGYLREGRDRLERLLALDAALTSARVRALHGAAVMASVTGDPETAAKRAAEAREMARALGDAWGEAYAEYMLATAATERKDWAAALPSYEASLEAFRELGDEHYVLVASDAIAWVSRELGDRERGRRLHEETLARARASGDHGVVALQLFQLAEYAREAGRIDDAFAMLREALVLSRDEGLPEGMAEVFVVMARTLEAIGAPARAPELLAAAARLRDEIGGGSGWVGEDIERLRASLRASLGDAAFEAAWERGSRLSSNEAVEYAVASAPQSASVQGADKLAEEPA